MRMHVPRAIDFIRMPMKQKRFLSALVRMLCAIPLLWALSIEVSLALTTGTVFRDYNADGTLDTEEPGVPGITVTAYASDGSTAATDTTDSNGDYSLGGLTNGDDYRIEFTGVPDYLEPGPFGVDSETTVAFVTEPASGVDLGLHNPGEHVRDLNPDMVTNRYLEYNQDDYSDGDSTTSTEANSVLVGFEYDDGCRNYNLDGDCTDGGETGGFRTPTPDFIADGEDIGATWGLAYSRETGSLFASAYMKRHTGFRVNGETGSIYRIENPTGGSPTITEYVDFDALGFDTGTDPHPDDTDPVDPDWQEDDNSWDPVGKMSFGDIDISDDGSTLWVINMFDRELYSVPVQSAAVIAGDIDSYDIVSETNCDTGEDDDVRPFGLKFHDGMVYVGVVCSAESTVPGSHTGGNVTTPVGDPADLQGIVLQFDPNTTTWTEVLDFPLNFSRGEAIDQDAPDAPAAWNPWVPVFTTINGVHHSRNEVAYPQPMITDIEFEDGNMIIGLRDRFGDQSGIIQRPPSTITDATYNAGGNCPLAPRCITGDAAGDMLRACGNPADGWTLESNGSCGGVTTSGAGNGQGPGGGEFYDEDFYSIYHDEVPVGGLAQLASDSNIASTAMDVINDADVAFGAGVYWMNHADGSREHIYTVYESVAGFNFTTPINTDTFAKANGLGDLELLIPPAPVEIGNRVWDDYNGDGIQDPGEPGIAGVDVGLYDDTGTLIETVTTDSDGTFVFSNDDRASDSPGRNYDVAIDIDTDYTLAILDSEFNGGTLDVYSNTLLPNEDGTTNDAIDDNNGSDGVTVSVGSGGNLASLGVDFATQTSGSNNHSFDFGVAQYDLGDAPDTYGTTLSGGARHLISRDSSGVSILHIGGVPDSEQDGQPGVNADDDAEEDGVSFSSPGGHTVQATVDVVNNTGGTVTVCAWMDIPTGGSVDGDFDDAGEGQCQTTSAGADTLTFFWNNLPGDQQYTTYTRFRITSDTLTTTDATGTVSDGEIEDHVVSFDFTPTVATIGQVNLDVFTVQAFAESLSLNEMETGDIAELLEVWDPDAVAYAGGDRAALVNGLMNYLDPDGDGQVAVFRWDTLEERGTIGFYVERSDGSGSWMRINNDLLPGLINAPLGAEYRLADPTARSGETYHYRLIELEATGTTRTYGPYVVEMP